MKKEADSNKKDRNEYREKHFHSQNLFHSSQKFSISKSSF